MQRTARCVKAESDLGPNCRKSDVGSSDGDIGAVPQFDSADNATVQRMAQIVEAVPNLGPDSRVLDVGSGTGCLIPFFRDRGVEDILAVDVSPDMLAKVQVRSHQLSEIL